MAKQTIAIELTEDELDTLYIGLDQACDNTADDDDYKYFQELMVKIKKAQKALTKQTQAI